jgi:hypothetical protein
MNYLQLLTYPKNLLKFLDNRRDELESERSRLSKMMDQDIKQINNAIVVSLIYDLYFLAFEERIK